MLCLNCIANPAGETGIDAAGNIFADYVHNCYVKDLPKVYRTAQTFRPSSLSCNRPG
ncbi:hypothetical protein GY45DRAFT_1323117 [Cubamyces sp. BRFM 1775]|nr:hypothetical protein GY45DRAFT_1323117 [Cubamyces sp. BRFM 1775]